MKKQPLVKYDIEDIEKAFMNIGNYSILNIDIESLYQFSSKEKHILERLKDVFSKVKLLKDYQIAEIEHFGDAKALETANSFLISLFPKHEKEILDLDKLIIFGDYSIYDAGVKYHLSKDNITLDKIIIPTDGSNYTASIIVHEKTHVLTFNNINLKSVFENNSELFPIFLQKLMLNKVDDYFSVLLDRIIRTNDIKQAFQYLSLAKHLNTNPNSTILDKQMSTYFNLTGYNYLLSELYSYLLMVAYIEDEEKMIKNLNQVLNNKLSISEFLASYQIGLTNKNLIPIIKEETNKCKRITIIP